MCGAARATTAEKALELIRAGKKAVLPRDQWATAYNVLRALGVDEETALAKIRFAQTRRGPA